MTAQEFAVKNIVKILEDIEKGFTPDSGTSDLDDEQPIWVSIPLGTYRKVRQVNYMLQYENFHKPKV